jgi:hypothetical protein
LKKKGFTHSKGFVEQLIYRGGDVVGKRMIIHFCKLSVTNCFDNGLVLQDEEHHDLLIIPDSLPHEFQVQNCHAFSLVKFFRSKMGREVMMLETRLEKHLETKDRGIRETILEQYMTLLLNCTRVGGNRLQPRMEYNLKSQLHGDISSFLNLDRQKEIDEAEETILRSFMNKECHDKEISQSAMESLESRKLLIAPEDVVDVHCSPIMVQLLNIKMNNEVAVAKTIYLEYLVSNMEELDGCRNSLANIFVLMKEPSNKLQKGLKVILNDNMDNQLVR